MYFRECSPGDFLSTESFRQVQNAPCPVSTGILSSRGTSWSHLGVRGAPSSLIPGEKQVWGRPSLASKTFEPEKADVTIVWKNSQPNPLFTVLIAQQVTALGWGKRNTKGEEVKKAFTFEVMQLPTMFPHDTANECLPKVCTLSACLVSSYSWPRILVEKANFRRPHLEWKSQKKPQTVHCLTCIWLYYTACTNKGTLTKHLDHTTNN